MVSDDYAGALAAAACLDGVKAAAEHYSDASPLQSHNPFFGSYSVSKAALNK